MDIGNVLTRDASHWLTDRCRERAPAWRETVEERLGFMLHVTCDGCGKELRAGEDHHVVKIEVFAPHDPAELTEADLDEDHMEAVGELLRQMEETDAQV